MYYISEFLLQFLVLLCNIHAVADSLCFENFVIFRSESGSAASLELYFFSRIHLISNCRENDLCPRKVESHSFYLIPHLSRLVL